MRIIDHCSSCFSSTSSDEGNSDGAGKRKRKKSLFVPLERYVLLLFGGDKKLSDQDYYSTFYASPGVQAKSFCAGKKYEIERKHKVKKRELLDDGLNKSCTTLRDNIIKGETVIEANFHSLNWRNEVSTRPGDEVFPHSLCLNEMS